MGIRYELNMMTKGTAIQSFDTLDGEEYEKAVGDAEEE